MPFDEAPSRRMAPDVDGTAVVDVRDTGQFSVPAANTPPPFAWNNTSLSDRQLMQNESVAGFQRATNTNYPWDMVGFIFPEPRQLDGWYQNGYTSVAAWEAYSLNTTNCQDGTWIDAAVTATTSTVLSDYRDSITSLAIPSVKGLLCLNSGGLNSRAGFRRIHIYGTILPGETPDRIIFLDTENADAKFTKVLDFGDIPRGQTTTRTFKIKNNSSSKTINTIEVTAEDLYLNAGDWYTFGDDGVNYQATFAVGNLGPGATKLLYLKQIIPDAETLGVQAGRIKASHASVT